MKHVTHRRRPFSALRLSATALLTSSSLVTPIIAGAQRAVVNRLDELPPVAIPVSVPVTELVTSPEVFAPFAAAARADAEKTLAEYDIRDAAAQQRLIGTLISLEILAGNFDEARAWIARDRELETKPGPRLTSGLVAESYMDAVERADSKDPSVLAPELRRALKERLSALPWETVQEEIEQIKGQFDMVSTNLIRGMAEAHLQPVVDKSGSVGREMAAQIVSFHNYQETFIPVRDTLREVLAEAIAAHRQEKPDIWQARNVTLDAATAREPIVVGIWDTGVDASVFPHSMWSNPRESADGRDDDGNGMIDDLHGIAFDLLHQRVPGLLYPMDEAQTPIPELEGLIKGLFDLRAALDTPEATALREKFASLPPAELKVFMEDLMRYALYSHGTHVAGIAVEGNPAARILVGRLTADHRAIGEVPTIEDAEASVREYQAVVDYFKAAGVRVVNMSWISTYQSVVAGLEQHGIGETPEERVALARRIFDIQRDGLEEAFRSAPEILFVGGAGNDDNDVSFDDIVPPAFDLPNLIIAGAVDQAGDPTSFTSFGKRVQVYANGFEVESFVPGGKRLSFSGSSMSAPNVTNLAAKLFALDPSLTPERVIDLIMRGSEVREGKESFRLIHPARTVELLRGT